MLKPASSNHLTRTGKPCSLVGLSHVVVQANTPGETLYTLYMLWLTDSWHFPPSSSLCESVIGILTLLVTQSFVHSLPCVRVANLHWHL